MELLTARNAWCAIGGFVLAYEVICPEGQLMSEGADRLIERHPYATRAAGLVLAVHVLNLVREEQDPISRLVRALR
jgi:hypothetical protein